MRNLILCVALGLLVWGEIRLTAPGVAADDDKVEAQFKNLDRDGNQKLSKAETHADKATTLFLKLDKDSDGSLSLDEFKLSKKTRK